MDYFFLQVEPTNALQFVCGGAPGLFGQHVLREWFDEKRDHFTSDGTGFLSQKE
jgi:hypothetical protein